MAMQYLSLETLPRVDSGKVSAALELHLKRAAMDCKDRPNETKARSVLMQIDIIPVTDDKGVCDEVSAQFHFKSTVPSHKTKSISLALKANGSLRFSEENPDDYSQTTLMDGEDK
jgi:hypothetical protein